MIGAFKRSLAAFYRHQFEETPWFRFSDGDSANWIGLRKQSEDRLRRSFTWLIRDRFCHCVRSSFASGSFGVRTLISHRERGYVDFAWQQPLRSPPRSVSIWHLLLNWNAFQGDDEAHWVIDYCHQTVMSRSEIKSGGCIFPYQSMSFSRNHQELARSSERDD